MAQRIAGYLAGVQVRLRAAELARAAETARAEEADQRTQAERRARRFQVGLAASLLVLTAAGGLALASYLQQRQARFAMLDQVLAETTALLRKAQDDASDPAPWRDALAALGRVEGQGPESRIDALRGEIQAGLDDAERTTTLRRDLVEVCSNQQDVEVEDTDRGYSAAFQAARLDLDALEPAEFARRLRRQPEEVVVELTAFLDHWSAVRREAGRPVAAWRRPLEAARLADTDGYRDRLRTILLAEDRKPEAETLKALAEAPEAADLPPATAVLLGRTLEDIEHGDSAAALLRLAASRHPEDIWVSYNLARTLGARPGSREEAVRYYTAARALRPESGHDLAHLLENMGRGSEAEGIFRDLVNRRPDNPRHMGCLGSNLKERGRHAEAEEFLGRAFTEYRTAIRLKPDLVGAHLNLGQILRGQGDYSGSLAEIRKGHELGSKQPGWRFPSAQWLKEAERLASLAARLPVLLKGDDQPRDNAERLSLAQMCYDSKRPAAAVGLWAVAFKTDPRLADDRQAQLGYNAACAASLAAAGTGTGEPPPDAAARAKLRSQALGWLKAEIVLWAKTLDGAPTRMKASIAPTLKHWKIDTELAGIRDPDALAKLPEPERKQWQAFWEEVEDLLKRAEALKP